MASEDSKDRRDAPNEPEDPPAAKRQKPAGPALLSWSALAAEAAEPRFGPIDFADLIAREEFYPDVLLVAKDGQKMAFTRLFLKPYRVFQVMLAGELEPGRELLTQFSRGQLDCILNFIWHCQSTSVSFPAFQEAFTSATRLMTSEALCDFILAFHGYELKGLAELGMRALAQSAQITDRLANKLVAANIDVAPLIRPIFDRKMLLARTGAALDLHPRFLHVCLDSATQPSDKAHMAYTIVRRCPQPLPRDFASVFEPLLMRELAHGSKGHKIAHFVKSLERYPDIGGVYLLGLVARAMFPRFLRGKRQFAADTFRELDEINARADSMPTAPSAPTTGAAAGARPTVPPVTGAATRSLPATRPSTRP